MRLLLYFWLVLITACSITLQAQHRVSRKMSSYPEDFTIQLSAGGLAPWTWHALVHLYADGHADYIQYIPNDLTSPPLKQKEFRLDSTQREALWKAVQENHFFALDSLYTDEHVKDGFFYTLDITANHRSHQVTVQNIHQPQFDTIIQEIARLMPPDCDL